MSEKPWWEIHALLLGKLTGNLLTIEFLARLMIAKHEVGGDLKKLSRSFHGSKKVIGSKSHLLATKRI